MKKSELKLMIREIVREEVRMAINETRKDKEVQNKEVTGAAAAKPIKSKKHFSKNPILNQVLNETAEGGDWKTLGGKEFTTERMNDIVGGNYGEMMNTNQPLSADSMISSMGKNPEQVPDSLKKALTRDYSSLVKTMNKNPKGKIEKGTVNG